MCAVTPWIAAELIADATPVIVVAPVVTAVPLVVDSEDGRFREKGFGANENSRHDEEDGSGK